MLYVVDSINGSVLWANLNLLFWLSLIPFATAWMGDNHFTKWPVVLYGTVLIMNGFAYSILSWMLIRCSGRHSALAEAVGNDWKGKVSLVIYAVAIALAFVNPKISVCLYITVAIVWFIPDTRIERKIINQDKHINN